MAIDSAQKRASAATVSSVWAGPSVISDGSFDAADRAHIGWSYGGNAIGVGIRPLITIDTITRITDARGFLDLTGVIKCLQKWIKSKQ